MTGTDYGIFLWVFCVLVGGLFSIALVIAPLMIWHYTHAIRDEARKMRDLLVRIQFAVTHIEIIPAACDDDDDEA